MLAAGFQEHCRLSHKQQQGQAVLAAEPLQLT
jgi:hypothetical protein